MKCIAKTMAGLEEVLKEELESQGAKKCRILRRAISFEADLEVLYRCNLHCRTAIRILVQQYHLQATDAREMYEKVKELPWEDHLELDETFAIDAAVNSEHFPHSKYAALKMKDAIADRFRLKFGKRPDVDTVEADLNLHLFIFEDKVSISIDSSGSSLHRRGYRSSGHRSPLNEVLAAGMIMLSGWDKKTPLLDPMCGTGTVAIEAAMMASNTPPGHLRTNYGFMQWKNYDEALWKKVKEEAALAIKPCEAPIAASDISGIHVRMARTAAEAIGLDEYITFEKADFFEQSANEGYVIMNPPYGERMGHNDIEEFYEQIADQLKAGFTGTECWLISSNNDALLRFGLRPSKKITLYNGALECLFQKFELYAGSRKAKWADSEIDKVIRDFEGPSHDREDRGDRGNRGDREERSDRAPRGDRDREFKPKREFKPRRDDRPRRDDKPSYKPRENRNSDSSYKKNDSRKPYTPRDNRNSEAPSKRLNLKSFKKGNKGKTGEEDQ